MTECCAPLSSATTHNAFKRYRSSMLKASRVFTLTASVIFAAGCGTAGAQGPSVIKCSVVNYGSNSGSMSNNATCIDFHMDDRLRETLMEQVISDAFYQRIMGFANEHYSFKPSDSRERHAFRDTYPALTQPRALAVCISWDNSSPSVLQLQVPRQGWVVSKTSGHCEIRNELEAEACAVSKCIESRQCEGSRTCMAVDANGLNAIRLPRKWKEKHNVK